MTSEKITQRLRFEAERLADIVPGTTWYLFGSVTRMDPPADVDLLILYGNNEERLMLRHELVELTLKMPIHLLLVTRDEESQLDFIRGQRCVQIYP